MHFLWLFFAHYNSSYMPAGSFICSHCSHKCKHNFNSLNMQLWCVWTGSAPLQVLIKALNLRYTQIFFPRVIKGDRERCALRWRGQDACGQVSRSDQVYDWPQLVMLLYAVVPLWVWILRFVSAESKVDTSVKSVCSVLKLKALWERCGKCFLAAIWVLVHTKSVCFENRNGTFRISQRKSWTHRWWNTPFH